MNIHKRTRLTLLNRQEIWRLYQTRLWKVAHLAERFHVSRPTIYDVLKRARLQEFTPRDSTNQRFKTLQYGLKRLTKVEQTIQERLKREARRYNKSYPGELVHFDTKRLPLLKGQSADEPPAGQACRRPGVRPATAHLARRPAASDWGASGHRPPGSAPWSPGRPTCRRRSRTAPAARSTRTRR